LVIPVFQLSMMMVNQMVTNRIMGLMISHHATLTLGLREHSTAPLQTGQRPHPQRERLSQLN
ncbi:MAG: hypothetical protein EB121_07380, partial [Alphaproteobacteria bacterium]|nr:hypothetical protein [Alphaproteobacteria bacterium]